MQTIRTTYLERLLTCPYQLHLSNVYPSLDIPSDGQERGRTFHQFVNYVLLAEDREAAYKQALADIGRIRPDALAGFSALWHKLLSNKNLEVIATESSFSRQLDIDGTPVEFTGTIDAVFRLQGDLVICDFKLLKNPRNFQPTLQRFSYVLLSPFRDIADYFWFILVGTQGTLDILPYAAHSIREDPEHEQMLINLIRHYIHLDKHLYKRPGKHCSWCPFLSICRPQSDIATGKILSLISDYAAPCEIG